MSEEKQVVDAVIVVFAAIGMFAVFLAIFLGIAKLATRQAKSPKPSKPAAKYPPYIDWRLLDHTALTPEQLNRLVPVLKPWDRLPIARVYEVIPRAMGWLEYRCGTVVDDEGDCMDRSYYVRKTANDSVSHPPLMLSDWDWSGSGLWQLDLKEEAKRHKARQKAQGRP